MCACACEREQCEFSKIRLIAVNLGVKTIDINREGGPGEVEGLGGDWPCMETRVRTYGDVTDDVPFGYRPHAKKDCDCTHPYIASYSAAFFSLFFFTATWRFLA